MTRFLASMLLLALSVPAVAQPGPAVRAPFIPPKDANFDLFRALLHFYGVEPATPGDLDDLRDRDFSQVIVVVLGASDRVGTRGVEKYTRKAIDKGGAVLIAADADAKLSDYFPDQTSVSAGPRPAPPGRPDNCYAGDPNFPFLFPTPNRDQPPSLVALLNDRDRVAMNRPGALFPVKFGPAIQHVVAKAPLDTRGNAHYAVLGGVGDRRNPFRSLVLADQDILSNQMLYSSGLPDRTGKPTDNWGFANALVKDFLLDPQPRTKCLFVENGAVRTDFDRVELKSIQQMPSMPPIPLPDPLDRRVQAKLAEVIDGGLATLEDRTVADNLLAGPPNDPSPRRYQTTMTVLATAAGVVLVVLMARRLLTARHRKKFVPAPSDPLFLGDDTALGSFGQRRAELLRGTDFRAAVAYGVRALFAAQGLPAGYGRRRLPPLEYRGRSDRERLGGDIRDLWDAAARDEAVSLSYAEWKDLEPVLAEVHAAAAADRWRFAPTSPQGSA